MAFDPDLTPVFDLIDGRLSALEVRPDPAPQLAARLCVLEEAPPVPDLTAAVSALAARIATLETRLVVPPLFTAPRNMPIWNDLSAEPMVFTPPEIRVPAGTREILIPVSVTNGYIRQSFYVFIAAMTNDPAGGGINVGNFETQTRLFNLDMKPYVWSPGDDPTHYVKLICRDSYAAGQSVLCNIRYKGLSDSQKGRQVRIMWTADAAPQPAPERQHHRPLRRLDLTRAARANSFDPSAVRWSPTGFDAHGKPVWRSQLAHGRTQDGNGETGVYADETVPGADTPISFDAEEKAIRLHTRAFDDARRIEWDNRLFRHQAAVIQGQKLPEVSGASGVWRMVAKVPSRAYCWPAFWLIAGIATGGSAWPPEIDILEKFNGVWGEMDTRHTTTFAQHFGNLGSNARIGAFGSQIELNQWPAGQNGSAPIDEAYRSWACAVVYDDADPTRCEVTYFVDDVEVGCHVLFARHQDMKTRAPLYPIINVAVRAPANYSAADYNADTARGGLSGDMLVRDVGYYPAGFVLQDLV